MFTKYNRITRLTNLRKISISEFGNVLIRYATAQVASNFLRLLSGLLVARSIDPETYGQFTGVGIYLGYILLGHGGIINGLNRELPFELGRKNDEYARQMASSVYVLSLVIGISVTLIFLCIGIFNLVNENKLNGLIFISYAIIGGLQIFNKQFLPVLYRTNKDFDSISRQNLNVGLGNLISVLLVWAFNIYGLMLRGILLAIYEFYLLYKNKPYQLKIQIEWAHFRKLFKTGFPIFLVGYVNPLWITFLNNMIFSIGGALNFGLYAICAIVQGAIGVIPNAFSQVIYPRMAIMLGQGMSVTEILKSNTKPLFFQFGLMVTIGITGAIMLPIVVPLILPKYNGGIVAAQWMLFVPAVQSFGALNNIYNVVKKQMWYLISLVGGGVVGSAFILIQINQNGFNLETFPQGILIGTGIQQLFGLLMIKKLM